MEADVPVLPVTGTAVEGSRSMAVVIPFGCSRGVGTVSTSSFVVTFVEAEAAPWTASSSPGSRLGIISISSPSCNNEHCRQRSPPRRSWRMCPHSDRLVKSLVSFLQVLEYRTKSELQILSQTSIGLHLHFQFCCSRLSWWRRRCNSQLFEYALLAWHRVRVVGWSLADGGDGRLEEGFTLFLMKKRSYILQSGCFGYLRGSTYCCRHLQHHSIISQETEPALDIGGNVSERLFRNSQQQNRV